MARVAANTDHVGARWITATAKRDPIGLELERIGPERLSEPERASQGL